MEIINPDKQAKLAKEYYLKGDHEKAAEAYLLIQNHFSAKGDSLKAAEMANNRAVVLLQLGKAEAAMEAVSGTEEVFEVSDNALLKAMAIGNRAACLEQLKQFEEAEKEYKRCAALLKGLGEDQYYAETMKSLSGLQLKQGKNLEALANMQSGVEEIKRPSLSQRLVKRILNLPSNFIKK